ncbi:hypothetical protein [Myxococcus sp. RHSTA-1-4]|uniref:hypothetical protein n=1 Tax=Myxococcus sp. RHSTA-1-4 TaxID=2874601 RepID=UPI001CBC3776|nr:hypothetical protein [Myxococcus sp. RHSTA-1-4]MBZ4420708.1 hypothetical protein [Myxococcus sp. RHSTA-1-4]
MRAEPLPRWWAGLLLGLALFGTGCASLASRTRTSGDVASFPRPSTAPELRLVPGGTPEDAASVGASPEAEEEGPLRRRRATKREQGSAVAGPRPAEVAREATVPRGGVPPGGATGEVLTRFLECASPAEFVALQRTVDMPRWVESLKDWDAVRFGALGPVSAETAAVLNRKRAAFIVTATEMYGHARAEVFALFILHSAFDDELREVLWLLAGDKQLGETLGRMGSVREELARRGLRLSDSPDRSERAGDVLRGLGRAGRDALSSALVSDGARYLDFSAKRGQLPPPYQEALDAVERALMEQHFSPGSIALGSFDHLTFGVPLGFFHLAAGTGQGASSFVQGRYEQATRELAPAGLLVALYAGGRGARHLSEAGVVRRLQVPPLSLEGLKPVVDRLSERLGANALGEVARYIQASREAGLLVAEWGEVGAAALHEARGNVPRAQAYLSEAKPPRAGADAARAAGVKRGGGVAAEALEAGLPPEVLRAKLLLAELEAPGSRLPRDVEALKQLAPRVDAPPPGVPEGTGLWREYVAYREARLGEIIEGRPAQGPLRWEGYQVMRGLFARGGMFEWRMVSLLREDAALPRAQRRWLGDFIEPRIETHVGVAKADLRYVDVLVIETRPPVGEPPRVETFSFKSRDLSRLDAEGLSAQMTADASDAMRYYGGVMRIRRPGLQMEVRVQRVRLVYEGGRLQPRSRSEKESAMNSVRTEVRGVEVQFQ